jgi:hypothetical protein
MKILIAGSHGMVGSAVTRLLCECGYEVARLVRHAPDPGEVWWDPLILGKSIQPAWMVLMALYIWLPHPGQCDGLKKQNKRCGQIA